MRHGFILIDKPVGPTSHDAVQAVRKQLHERSVGHMGTLDPAASGLLVIAVGTKALKVVEYFGGMSKEYEAGVRFGAISTTYDADGTVEAVQAPAGWTPPEEVQLRRAIQERFIGKISQTPPAHSAVHVNGERAYDLARKGIAVEMKARTVQIDSCDILTYDYPNATLGVSCGSGTYIRSLAHDLGQVLRCGAYLSSLRRTNVGKWSVEDAVSPKDAAWTNVIPLKDVLKGEPSMELTEQEWTDVGHGRTIAKTIDREVFAWFDGLPVAVMIPADGGSRPRKVF